MMGWGLMSVAALGTLVWRHPLADVAGKAAAPIGAAFTFLCLVTGSLWGRPTWGTYWVWDARLTSELVLLLLYFGVLALYWTAEDPGRGARAAAILALVGAVNLPIIKFSVDWWNTLHQGESIFRIGGSTIDPSILWPLLIMAHRLHAAVRRAAARRHAQRNPAPARARDAHDARRRRISPEANHPMESSGRTPTSSSPPTRWPRSWWRRWSPGSRSTMRRSGASSAIWKSAASRRRSARDSAMSTASDNAPAKRRNILVLLPLGRLPGAGGAVPLPASAPAIPRAFPRR